MPTLEDTIIFVTEAHRGAVDRLGEPFILHVLRVMLGVESETERIVALLHDVVEKTDKTLDDLRAASYSDEVVAAVDALTKREHEPYMDMLARVKANLLAIPVKKADIADHADVRHNPLLMESDLERLQNYQRGWWELTKDG